MPTEEIWRRVPDFDEYEVSNQGRMRSWNARRTKPELLPRPMKLRLTPNGYVTVKLSNPGRTMRINVHSLVLLAFRGPKPKGLECRHLDGNQTNNNLSNLVYGTHSENMLDKVAHGTHHLANKTHCVRGHSFAEHGRIRANGWRRCLACQRQDDVGRKR
jgi:hypothetical protein